MTAVAAVILAAGRSSRLAPRNKLLETIGGRAVIARAAETALASGAAPVLVVTGHDAERIEQALSGLRIAFVHNPDFAQGMSTSLRAGLAALPPSIDGALIMLGDMPLVATSDVSSLIAAFAPIGRSAICVPTRHGRRGNPVLWGAAYFPEIMRLGGDIGAKPLLEIHRERVLEVEASSDGIFADVDNLSDLARLNTQAGPDS